MSEQKVKFFHEEHEDDELLYSAIIRDVNEKQTITFRCHLGDSQFWETGSVPLKIFKAASKWFEEEIVLESINGLGVTPDDETFDFITLIDKANKETIEYINHLAGSDNDSEAVEDL